MGKRTGKPRGRPKGARSKGTIAHEKVMAAKAEAIEGTLPEPFHGDAHALLMATYKDTRLQMQLRLQAATAALPYEKPRLQATEQKPERAELPLHERLALYAREENIEASGGKVVDMTRRAK